MAHAKRLWPKHSSPTNIQIERDNMQNKVIIEASEVRAILFEAIDHGGNESAETVELSMDRDGNAIFQWESSPA